MSIELRLLSGDAFDFETITVADSAIGFTKATYNADNDGQAHRRAVVTCEGSMLRYKYNGDNPSTTSGHLLSHGDILIVEGNTNLANFRAIRTGSQSATLSVSYERVY